jgi:biotin transport system substrate-specific component
MLTLMRIHVNNHLLQGGTKMKKWSTRQLAFAALFAALTGVFSYVTIPIGPVPITLQTLAVMLAGCLLGARLGFFSQLIFVLLVGIGILVLPGGRTGLGVLLGPTGGYIVSWPFAAWVIGWVAERAQRRERPMLLLFLGNLVGGILLVYAVGVAWLAHAQHWAVNKALAVGALPFIPGDLIKAVIAGFISAGVARVYPIDRILCRESDKGEAA